MPLIQQLIVDQYGAFVGKHSQRLQVKVKGEKTIQAPLLHLEQVLITGRGVSLSAEAIRACCQEGIPIHFVSGSGKPYAGLYAAGLTGTVQTRRAQLLAYEDGRGLALAKAFASGKIENQSRLLKYTAKYRKEADPSLYEQLRLAAQEVLDHQEELRQLRAERVDEVRLQILAAEGRAARRYWDALKLMVPEQYDWPGRRRRGAKDPLNAALNYGYGILYGQIERAIILAGLDPFGGFIHADRPGKPSLVLDLIEEFRAPVVDRTVLGLVNKRTRLAQDEKGLLTLDTRRLLAERVLARLETAERYERKRQPLRVIIQHQARHIATFVRGDRAQYKPFLARW